MLAAVYHGPEDIRLSKVPKPVPGRGEVVVKVKSSVICATDIKMFRGVHSYVEKNRELIFGHENSGIISDIGPDVSGYSSGQAVFIAPNIGCGKCHHCINGHNNVCTNVEQIGMSINGGFSEYLLVPERAISQGNLISIGPDIDFAIASLTEPLACVLRGQKPLQIGPDTIVLIVGGGPIGMLHLKLAQLHNPIKIIVSEPNEIRRNIAVELGADCVVDPKNNDLIKIVNNESNGRGADVIIIAAPSADAQAESVKLASIKGRICFFAGLPKNKTQLMLDSNVMHYKELVISGSSGNSTSNCREALLIINARKLNLSSMITARYPLTQIHAAFEEAQKPQSLKIAIEP